MVLTVTIHDPFSNAWKSDPIFGIAVDTIVLSHHDDERYVKFSNDWNFRRQEFAKELI
jgi:hypothetical protein